MSNKFQESLNRYVEHIIKDYQKFGSNGNLTITFEKGQKFIRVVRTNCGSSSSHSFIALGDAKWPEGTILKSASWKAPAQNKSRGNIFDEKYSRVSWCGVN